MADIAKLVEELSKLTVLEAAELAKAQDESGAEEPAQPEGSGPRRDAGSTTRLRKGRSTEEASTEEEPSVDPGL